MDNLFSTHPSTENRIAALEAMAGEFATAKPHPPRRPARLSPVRDHGAAIRPGPSRSPTGPKGPWS